MHYYVSIDPRNDRQEDQTTLIEPIGGVVWGQDYMAHPIYTSLFHPGEAYCIGRRTQHTCMHHLGSLHKCLQWLQVITTCHFLRNVPFL